MSGTSEIKENAPAGPAGLMAPTERRVPASTSKLNNARINERTINTIKSLGTASYSNLTSHIRRLQWEWDMERALEANAASFILIALTVLGLAMGHPVAASLCTSAIASLLLLHSLLGWCPPVQLLRRLGVRTSYEIMDELVALRLLRGDFDTLVGGPKDTQAFNEGRRADMIDRLTSNMRDSGRLLGPI